MILFRKHSFIKKVLEHHLDQIVTNMVEVYYYISLYITDHVFLISNDIEAFFSEIKVNTCK